MTDPEANIRVVDIKGRNVSIKPLTDAQLLLMNRDAQLLQKDSVPSAAKLQAGAWILDAFESVIISEDDKAYVTLLMRTGDLTLTDFVSFLSAFSDEPVKPVVRRGRPRKSTK
jgi:predicted lysophospholipase L1 biosynthesis ABC-type transport system permease subunit